jgi:DNA-binding MarR family transcriptional regulator
MQLLDETRIQVVARQLATIGPRLGKTLRRQVRPAAGLSMPQFITLRALSHGPRSASVLANIFGVSRPTVTRMVDGLVKKGLVERHHDAGDRRLAIISLTGDGRELQASSEEAAECFLRGLLDHLPADRLDRLSAALSDLGTLLDQAETKPPSNKERP